MMRRSYSPIFPIVKEPTGSMRVRLVKRWFGVQTIVEREHHIEYRHCDRPPESPPLRVELQWLRASRWNVLGRNFYAEAR